MYDDRHASSDDYNARYCARGCYRIIFFSLLIAKDNRVLHFSMYRKSETCDILNMYCIRIMNIIISFYIESIDKDVKLFSWVENLDISK